MIVKTTRTADAVLASVDALLKESQSLYQEPYQNGAEHGWSLYNTNGLRVAFSLSRYSDAIVVYRGKTINFNPVGNVPDKETCTYRELFPPYGINLAALSILAYLA